MNAALRIDRRFNGPPTSANGGWVSGLLAARLLAGTAADQGVSVSLRAPPPLDTDLQVLAQPDGSLVLSHEGTTLAQAQRDTLELDLPALPSLAASVDAGRRGHERALLRSSWPYAKCFGCGVARDDGMCITPSPLEGVGETGMVAAPWTPTMWLADDEGHVRTEAIWAALDCPAGIAWSYRLPDGSPMVTARMTLRILSPVRAGQPHAVLGWPIAQEGRKLHAGTALLDAQGQVLAVSRQLWLQPRTA